MIDEDLQPDPAARLTDEQGRPLRASTGRCPRCGAPPSKRVASSGFGRPYPICSLCGYEFTDEQWVAP
jgi:transposase-like protein